MKAIKLLIPIILAGMLFFSCGDGVVDPIDDVPTDLAINQFEDGKIELSWIYFNPSDSDTISYYVARKVGGNSWAEYGWGTNGDYGSNLDEETTSLIDHIPTTDTLAYAYKVRFRDHTTEKFSNYSETIAYLSENTTPTNLVSLQTSQEELLISWEDHCVGEDGYKVDRKLGNESWVKEYQLLPEDATSFIDEVTLYDTLLYRVYAYLGISETETAVDSVFNSLATPIELQTVILDDDKLRLNWIDTSIGEEGFYIDRKIGFLDWQIDYAVVDSNITTFVEDFTLPCATMQFRVRAYQGIYSSNYSIIDTTNVHLGVIGSSYTPGDATEMAMSDWTAIHRTAFVADDYSGLSMVDCINPSEPIYISSYILADETISVSIADNFAYVATHSGNSSPGQIQKVDIIDESQPVLVGSTDTQGIPKDIFVYGAYAYVAEGISGLTIYYNGVTLYFQSNLPLSDARKLDFYDHYAFVANGMGGLEIIDIFTPTNPIHISNFPTTGSCNDIHVEDNIAFIANGENGLTIVDVSNVFNPIYLSQLETGGYAYGVFADGDYVYLIDKETGFYVVDVTNPVNPYVLGYLKMTTEPVSVTLVGSYVYLTDNEGLKTVQVKP
jgi:hypothetical protein